MSARDDFRALASWSGAPFGAAVMEARRALDEIDQLRADVATLRQAFQRDLQGLRDERDALLARRDEVMRLSGEQVRRSTALVDAVRLWSRTTDARGGAHDRLQDAWDDYTLERRRRWDEYVDDLSDEGSER